MRCRRSHASTLALLFLAASSFAPTPARAQAHRFDQGASFTKVTEGPLVTEVANWTTSAWGDFDDDGDLDAFLGAQIQSTRNYLYRNDGDLGFTLVEDAAMPKIASNQHSAAWGDTDNDGDLDLVVTSGQPEVGSNMLYRNNGDGTFAWTDTGISRSPFVHGFHGASLGDYDNDGFVDLFIGAHDDYNHLYHNEGDGTFTELASHVLIDDQTTGGSEGRSWVDYDGDGDIDLHATRVFARIGTRIRVTNVLYRNDGAGAFTRVTNGGLSNRDERGTFAVCWADYDNDGRQDVFITNASSDNALYHNDGGGTFSRVGTSTPELEPLPTSTSFFASCGWGDYDNDGFVDLAVGTADLTFPTPNPNRTLLYRNNGDGTFAKVTDGAVPEEPGGIGILAWVDYDNDGFLDLNGVRGVFAPTTKTATLFHNDGNANAWLNVKLVGTVSNRSAIGAKVRVQATFRGASRWLLREIIAGDSLGTMQSLNAEFGLADAARIDTVRVEWPSGVVQELHGVAPRQFLTITEPLPVAIDVKPGNPGNLVDPFSTGMLPVALLGSATLDVRDVDVETLAFGPAAAEPVRGDAGPALRDVDADGLVDLVVAFPIQETGIAAGDTEACLSGRVQEGPPLQGCDAIATATASACGVGFELALGVPPLAWLYRRRRARK
jgi:hypothetical protein